MEANRQRGDDNTETVRRFNAHPVRDGLELLFPQTSPKDIGNPWHPPLYAAWVLAWLGLGIIFGLYWVNPTHAIIHNGVMLALWCSGALGILLSIIAAFDNRRLSVILAACTGFYFGTLMGIHHWPMPDLLSTQITDEMQLETDVGLPKFTVEVMYITLPRLAVMTYCLILCQGFIQPNRPPIAGLPIAVYAFFGADFAASAIVEAWIVNSPWLDTDPTLAALITAPALLAGWRVVEHYETLFPLMDTWGIVVDAFFFQVFAFLFLGIFGCMAVLTAQATNLTYLRFGDMPSKKTFERGGRITHPSAWRLSRRAGFIVAAGAAFLPFIFYLDAILMIAYGLIMVILNMGAYGKHIPPEDRSRP